ncbi:amidase signature domain-containing protein [Mycena leptocephala]|nr:amidase signature domain-containing protein [Mycena leptocephala]
MRVNVTRLGTRQISSWRKAICEKNHSINAFAYGYTTPPPEPSPEHLPLANVAIGVKDMICTSDMRTTCSSLMLKSFIPPFDATVVTLLRQAGADIVGKLNCDEFGMGSLNFNSVHGPVVNPFQAASSSVPWQERELRYSGGSSGGSAAAVAADMCYAALSTDTGGSTRLPASYCGVVGLKPSYGLISRWGVISFADSLDCVGVMAKDVSATKRVFDILNAYDSRDPTSASSDARQMASQEAALAWPSSALTDLRIGIPHEYFPSELTDEVLTPVRAAIEGLKSQGATIVPVSLPSTPYALSAYYVISSAEASSNMARYDGVQYGSQIPLDPETDRTTTATIYAHTRSLRLGWEVQKRILLGTYALTADQRIRQLIRDDFNRVLRVPDGVDVLIHPSAIRTAPPFEPLDPSTPDNDGLNMYVQDVLTVPASLAGLPALSVPLPTKGNEWPMSRNALGHGVTDASFLELSPPKNVQKWKPSRALESRAGHYARES